MRSVHLVDYDWATSVTCPAAGRPGVRLLFYSDGTVRVEHKCRVIDGIQLIVAPKLLEVHTIDDNREWPTVTPSITCPDCYLHGFVRKGRWVPA